MILIRFVFELQTAFHDNTGDSLDIFSTQDFCRFGEQLAYAASTQLVDQFNQSFVIAEETDQQVIAESINFLYDANNSLVRQKQQQQQQQQRQQLNHQYSRPVQLEPALKLQHLDYRYGRISIDWMDARSSDMKPTAVTHLKPTANKRQRRAAKAAAVAEPSEYLPFVSGHTDLNYGILRFYRNQHRAIDSIAGDDKLTVLAVLAVPTFMSIADYMQFIRPFDSQISHFRIVHDSQPNRYMVLMKFRDAAAAADFYQQMNGRAFSPMRPELCNVAYVESVEFKNSTVPDYAFPLAGTLSNKSSTNDTGVGNEITPTHSAANGGKRDNDDNEEAGLIELPTCPVCLDRMDSTVTGMITIMCHHTFHCQCLSKWADSTCPVCRYSDRRGTATADHCSRQANELNECTRCRTHSNLWICLICGHVGCGRYQNAHAQAHYVETNHLYAMELETSRVWDYQGDGYVHRLIQNKSDGKLVELSGPSDKESAKKLSQDKLDALGLEFSYLLTSSLESQRQFYEDQLAEITAKYTQQHNSMQELEQRYSHLRALHQRLVERCEVETERLQELQSLSIKQCAENKQWQERLRQQQQRIKELEKGWEDEKAVSASLQSTTSLWVGKIKEKDRLIAEKQQMITELQEQVNDLMIFLDSREKIEDLVAAAGSPSEQQSIIEGSVGVAPSEAQAVKNRAAAAASRRKAKKRW